MLLLMNVCTKFPCHLCSEIDFLFVLELISPEDLLQACSLWEKFDVYVYHFLDIIAEAFNCQNIQIQDDIKTRVI